LEEMVQQINKTAEDEKSTWKTEERTNHDSKTI
jgi:hypothetical protein